MKLSKKDQELIDVATKVVKENCNIYPSVNLHVACALRAKSGNVYVGINLKTSHSVCAEQVAIGNAYACGEREFETIVAVQLDNNYQPHIVAPCGLCRYIFDKLDLNMFIIVPNGKKLAKVNVKDLLPYPYVKN